MRNLSAIECEQIFGAKAGKETNQRLSEEILAELMLVGTGFGLTLGLKLASSVGNGHWVSYVGCTTLGSILGATLFPAAAYQMFSFIKPFYLD